MLLCWKVLKLNEDVSIRSVEKRKKLPTKQFSWFFFSLSPHWLPDMLEISGSKDLRYLSIRSSIYRCWADHEDYKKLQLYLRWYIFSWSQIYIQCLFLVCCMRFLWVFLHLFFVVGFIMNFAKEYWINVYVFTICT